MAVALLLKASSTGVTDITEDGGGIYNLQSGYSSPTGSAADTVAGNKPNRNYYCNQHCASEAVLKALRYDPDIAWADGRLHTALRSITFESTADDCYSSTSILIT